MMKKVSNKVDSLTEFIMPKQLIYKQVSLLNCDIQLRSQKQLDWFFFFTPKYFRVVKVKIPRDFVVREPIGFTKAVANQLVEDLLPRRVLSNSVGS